MYQQVGDAYAVFASAAGDDEDPAWFRTVVANPSVTAEIGTDMLRLKARVLDDAEQEPIWKHQKREQPGFADYERTTSRTIPVVLMER